MKTNKKELLDSFKGGLIGADQGDQKRGGFAGNRALENLAR